MNSCPTGCRRRRKALQYCVLLRKAADRWGWHDWECRRLWQVVEISFELCKAVKDCGGCGRMVGIREEQDG